MSIDTACFSKDGNSIVVCSILGSMTVFRADDIGLTTLQPIEQYLKCEVDNSITE